jgi:hypothetical protein
MTKAQTWHYRATSTLTGAVRTGEVEADSVVAALKAAQTDLPPDVYAVKITVRRRRTERTMEMPMQKGWFGRVEIGSPTVSGPFSVHPAQTPPNRFRCTFSHTFLAAGGERRRGLGLF